MRFFVQRRSKYTDRVVSLELGSPRESNRAELDEDEDGSGDGNGADERPVSEWIEYIDHGLIVSFCVLR